ncbi:hypothetical protein H5410_054344 [Solanum commersonii]|uniref:C-JID domain-containing protein n=1 Tax=Solanum commersonii TaxID=4109 RepID=A0A9J5WF25_SOLCO|nr:hypothetical protein H5410_054344 [Solanum commersonii]
MHVLIEDMSKYIVKMQKDSGKRSRIWNVEDFEDVMMDNMGTMAVEAIWFTYIEQLNFDKEAMKNMKMLRILRIFPKDGCYRPAYFIKPDSNCHDGSIEYLSNNLCWFAWHDYPWKLLPEIFYPRRLVHRLTQLPEDIACLSSLKKLHLKGINFEHLPQSISELGALRSLELSDCKRLTLLPEFPQQLETIYADWSNASICNSLFQNISSLQHDICSSDSLSLRVFGSWPDDIPSWFDYWGMGRSVSVNLPKNWYVSDNFLGFAVCYSGIQSIDCITAHLIPLCDDGMSLMTQKFALSSHDLINFLLDASNANGKTPNDYGCFRLYSPLERNGWAKINEYGVRLLYKDEHELQIGSTSIYYSFFVGTSWWDASKANGKTPNDYIPLKKGMILEFVCCIKIRRSRYEEEGQWLLF